MDGIYYIELLIVYAHVYYIDCSLNYMLFLAIGVLLNNNGSDILKQKGQNVSFNCTADGNPRPVIVWKKMNNFYWAQVEEQLCHQSILMDFIPNIFLLQVY